jgi:hypothetical protein
VASPHFHKALPLFMVPLLPTLITLPTPPSIPFCSNLPPPPLFQILYPTPQVKNLPPLTPSRTLRGSTPLIRRRRPWCKQLARRRGQTLTRSSNGTPQTRMQWPLSQNMLSDLFLWCDSIATIPVP